MIDITPTPTEDEAAAIVAAIELCWPRPVVSENAVDAASETATPAWRFSGRWWSMPVPMRRHRPWVST